MDNESLVADLVEWIAKEPRAYKDAIEAWGTSCPRLSVWEDTVDAGLIAVQFKGTAGRYVVVTQKGGSYLSTVRGEPSDRGSEKGTKCGDF